MRRIDERGRAHGAGETGSTAPEERRPSLDAPGERASDPECIDTLRERWRAVFESPAVGVALVGGASRLREVNERFCSMLGYSREELLGKTWMEISLPDEIPRDVAGVTAMITGRVPSYTTEKRYVRKDGSHLWVLLSASPIRGRSGAVEEALIVVQEVSSLKAAEQALAARERRLADVFEGSSDGYFEDDLVRGKRFRSPRTNALLGLAAEGSEVDREGWERLIHPEDLPAASVAITPLLSGSVERAEFTCRARMPDGTWRWRLVRMWVGERQADGRPARTFGSVIDVDRIMVAEEALRASEERYRALVEVSADGIAILRNGIIEYANPAAGRILGVEDARLLVGRSELEFIDPGRRNLARSRIAEVMKGRAVRPEYVTLHRDDGRTVEVLSMPAFFRDTKGPGVLSLIHDVTEERRAVRAMTERKQEIEAILGTAMDGIWFTDAAGRFLDSNEAGCAMLGYSRDELMRMSVGDIALPRTPEEVPEKIQEVMAKGRVRFESRFRRKDGTARDAEVSLQYLRDDGRKVVAFVRDVTSRKEAEAALKASEERFRTLAEGAPVGVFVSSIEGEALYVNPSLEQLHGLCGAEALGRAWMERIHPDDRDAVGRAVFEAVSRQAPYECAYRIVHPSGTVRAVRAYASPLRGPTGVAQGYAGVVIDVTEQKRTERQLEMASRLGALGTLVAGVGHEINNPLAAIMAGEGFALDVLNHLRERLRSADPPPAAAVAAEIEETLEPLQDGIESGGRIAQIVKDLAVFGGSRAPTERIRPRSVVDSALRWLPTNLGSTPRVKVEDEGAPDVVALSGQLSQVVLNLISNAFRAGRDGVAPEVTVRLRTGASGQAVIEVEDDGHGMTPEVMDRIFDPFFTTRPAGDKRGVGLGLSLCQTIVAAHGGSIHVRSEPGRGSTFTVELPAPAR